MPVDLGRSLSMLDLGEFTPKWLPGLGRSAQVIAAGQTAESQDVRDRPVSGRG
jgi:hypothetical protein